jgi:hypothetical protein
MNGSPKWNFERPMLAKRRSRDDQRKEKPFEDPTPELMGDHATVGRHAKPWVWTGAVNISTGFLRWEYFKKSGKTIPALNKPVSIKT